MAEKDQIKSKSILSIQDILSLADKKVFKSGDMIFEEGADDPNFYIILEGDIEVSKKTAGGRSKVIAQAGEGDFIGEGALFGSIKKPASAKAITEVKTLMISADKFKELTENKPAAAVNFLLHTIETANKRLTESNTKLLALYEINQIMHTYRNDIDELAHNLTDKLIAITDSKYGILLSKNPFSNTYTVIHSTSPDLNEKLFDEFDLEKTQITESRNGKYMIIDLEGQGVLILGRDIGSDEYEADELRFLMLISEQLANVIKEAFEKETEKAKKMLERKHFEV